MKRPSRHSNLTLQFTLLFVLFLFSFCKTGYKNLPQWRQHYWDNLPQPNGLVNDYEDLFTKEEEATLDSLIHVIRDQYDIVIAIVTIDSGVVAAKDLDALTLHIANTWGIGNRDTDNGILIGISRGHGKMRIQNGSGIENVISDRETKIIVDDVFLTRYKHGFYFEGTMEGIGALVNLHQMNTFSLVEPDTGTIHRIWEENEYRIPQSLIYLQVHYGPGSGKEFVQSLEWSPKDTCAFHQIFDGSIRYQTWSCREAGGRTETITFPRLYTREARTFIETFFYDPANTWTSERHYEPEGAGCYYEIIQEKEHTVIKIYCGC